LNTVLVDGNPVIPSKIVCVGRNYVEHIEELGNSVPEDMVVFLKPNSAITRALQSVHAEPLHYEAEICLLCEKNRFSAVGFGLDLTKRALQDRLKAKGLPWERAKAFDGSALFSEFVGWPDDGSELTVELDINGINVQRGGTALMLYKPDAILAELRTFMSLNYGDIVMTGTPKGVGKVRAGDEFSGRIKAGGRQLVAGTWLAK
jgi:2-keto-4-pentenoate hydratase/2-oxohepta-3-ene-1,7-dioic acid hydratase in catechol pathway